MKNATSTSRVVVGVLLTLLLFDIGGSLFVIFGNQLLYRIDDPAIIDLVRKTGATIEGVGGVSNSFQGTDILSFQARSIQLKISSNQNA
jgi:hypothetical protein